MDETTIIQTEEWRDIPGYEGIYKVSSTGRIYSAPRTTTKGGLMRCHVNNKNGYVYAQLYKNGKTRNARVHRLVASAFLGNRPELQVNHIDGNKTNNSVSNLEYCTQSENVIHAYRTGLMDPYRREVIDLDTLDVYRSMTEAANAVGSNQPTGIYKVCIWYRSHHHGHHFAFYSDYKNGTIPVYSGRWRRKTNGESK